MTASAKPAHGGNPQMRTHFFDSAACAVENEEQPSHPPTCGARTRSGAPCDRPPEAGRRRCRLHGGAPSTGAPRGNTNARRHGRYSGQTREIRALGRLLNRVAELAKAQLAVANSRSHGDPQRVEIAENRVSTHMQRLSKAALALDRVLVERGNEGGRRLVEGAVRLAWLTTSNRPFAAGVGSDYDT
jgi:hypothetical protein